MRSKPVIRIRHGLDIPVPGTATLRLGDLAEPGHYAVKPTDHVGVEPRLLVGEGDTVMAGTPLFVDKRNPDAHFTSPVSGTVSAILRGEKRALLAVVVASDGAHKSTVFQSYDSTANPEGMSRDQVAALLVESGLWTALVRRPFGIAPTLNEQPKALFISTFDTSPLPVDYSFILAGREEDFQTGIDVLKRLAGTVHLSVSAPTRRKAIAEAGNLFFTQLRNVELHRFAGPHPAGLVGTQIASIDPINKGECVWTIGVQDVATIGHLFRTGEYRPERVVALCGPTVATPQYYRTFTGASVSGMAQLAKADADSAAVRLISGNVLSGTAIASDGYLSAGCDKVSVLPEGDRYDFLGWLRPNVRKFSASRTFLSGFVAGRQHRKCLEKCQFDTGYHGSRRPLFVTGEFERLVPIGIYPNELIKACITGDIERMEGLGIYEVEPEDLALCEFADTSKTEIQALVRQALELLRKEG